VTKWILEMHTHLKILRTRVFSWEGDRGVSKDREKIQKGVIFNLRVGAKKTKNKLELSCAKLR